MASQTTFDYVIAGGDLAGCVLATRLKEKLPSLSIALVEAGSDELKNPQIINPLAAPTLHGTPLEYNYKSIPQTALSCRQIDMYGGKLLSGSSGVNYGVWTRGNATDYNLWAQMVGDDRWSYKKLLPFFKKSETHHNRKADPAQHGFDGPIHTTGVGERTYPLRETAYAMFSKVGLRFNGDANSGNPFGFAEHTENWNKGLRQPAGQAYGLVGIEVMTNSVVKRIIINATTKTASGVELISGQHITARKEVIVCCGAMKTPQLLMLSGVGPRQTLEKLSIPQIIDAPEVGQNLHDHPSCVQFWKLQNPELGRALGHSGFNKPEYEQGWPIEFMVIASAPRDKLIAAMQTDGTVYDASHPYLMQPRADIETLIAYAPIGAVPGFEAPFDGTHIATVALCVLPTSRGSLTIHSTDPLAMPIINPAYFSTSADRLVIREAMRLNMRAVETIEGRSIIECEKPPAGFPTLSSHSTDEELDQRVQAFSGSFWHSGGTVTMGKVVDTECRVIGVKNLRVVDASILPVPLSAHYQAPMYAIAEAAAAMIAGDA